MTALLTSVRTVDEAHDAALAGADMIDMKEPEAGALGALPVETVRTIVQTMRVFHRGLLLSATIGDLAPADLAQIETMANAIGACGVDYVKIGIVPGAHAEATLERLAGMPWRIVPVFLCDAGLDLSLVRMACALGFPAIMADTADKLAGSLFDCVDDATLASMVATARARNIKVGLAGALRLQHLPQLRTLAPDFAGFRSASCDGGPAGRLDPAKVAALRSGLAAQPALLSD